MGRVHITSGLDPYAKLDFEPGYLNEWVDLLWLISEIDVSVFSLADLVTLRWVYKHAREIARRMEYYRGEYSVGHPTFAEGSQAATQLATNSTPVEISASEIVYSKEDDDAIDEFHRRTGSYTWNEIWTSTNVFLFAV